MKEEGFTAILRELHVTYLRRVALAANSGSSNHTIDPPPLQGY